MSLTDLAIESFIHQDLENESKNFKEWMDHHKKYKVRGSVSRTASPMNIVHRQDTRTVTIPRTENIASILSDLSDLEIDLLIKKLSKNKEAYHRWLAQKASESKKKLEREKKREAEELEKIKNLKIQQQLKKEQELKKVTQWKLKKEEQERLNRETHKLSEQAKSEMAARKRLENERKFNEWIAKKGTQMPQPAVIVNKKPWIPIPTSNTKRDNFKGDAILSPPNLYQEFTFYESNAPGFFKKYSNFVASAGKPSQSQPKPSTCAKTQKPLSAKTQTHSSANTQRPSSTKIQRPSSTKTQRPSSTKIQRPLSANTQRPLPAKRPGTAKNQ